MKRFLKYKKYLVLGLIFFMSNYPAAVTYTFSKGRFGDNLVSYLHAKWISYMYDIPLLYKPFPYSDKLVMHDAELKYAATDLKKFAQLVTVTRTRDIKFNKNSNTLYVIPYFPESDYEYYAASFSNLLFKVDWNNQTFKTLIRTMLAPKMPLKILELPTDVATIAVHIRTKSGTDILSTDVFAGNGKAAFFDVLFPVKHIADSYYVAQIKYLHDLIGKPKAYVFIFTDDANPPVVKSKIEQAVNRSELTFDCRQPGDHHCSGVLEDFFAMLQFQYFIGNDSNFSTVASYIGDYRIVIKPIYDWFSKMILLDNAHVCINPQALVK